MILTLQELGAERDIYLYDTFEGMTAPTEHDISPLDPPAIETWEAAAGRRTQRAVERAVRRRDFNEDTVREMLLETGYPSRAAALRPRPGGGDAARAAPGPLALLRLDTDWYESTQARARAPVSAARPTAAC